MKIQNFVRRRPRRVVAAAMLTALPAVSLPAVSLAATFTWNGGDSTFGTMTTGDDWVGGSSPYSAASGTADLLFASTNPHGFSPTMSGALAVNSLTFNTSALAYNIVTNGSGFSGILTIGAGGLTDNATNAESISGTTAVATTSTAQSWNIASGSFTDSTPLTLNGILTVNPSASAAVANFSGTLSGSTATGITKAGAGTLALTGSGSNIGDLFGSSGNLQVSGGSLTLTSGSEPIGITGGTIAVSNGASITSTAGAFEIGTIPGATGTFSITGGASATSQYGVVGYNTGTVGVATVSGMNSIWTMTTFLSLAGFSGAVGGTGTLTVSNNGAAVAPFTRFQSNLTLLNISGGTVTTGYLLSSGTGFGSIMLADPSGGTALTLNASSGSQTYSGTISGNGTLLKSGGSTQILSGSGTVGALTVQAGTLNFNGTTFNASAAITVSGGQFNVSAGTFGWAPSQTMNVKTGGQVYLAGIYGTPNNATINVTGSGSQLNQTGSSAELDISNGSLLSVTTGGSVTSALLFDIGVSGTASAVFDGAGTSFTTNTTYLGFNSGSAGTLNLRNNSTGSITGGIVLGEAAGSSGTLIVQSGASLSCGAIQDASFAGVSAYTGSINVSGGTINQIANSALNVGLTSGTTGTVTVQSGGFFNTSSAGVSVGATGTINNIGGTFNANGQILVGGVFNMAGGTFNWAASQVMSILSGGKVFVANQYTTPNGSTINLSGTGSLLSCISKGANSQLIINGGSQLNVSSGAAVTSSQLFDVGANGNGTATFDGTGTSLSVNGSAAFQNYVGVGGIGTLSFSNNSSGTLTGSLSVGTFGPGSGTLNVLSGASLSVGNIDLADAGGLSATGTINVSGGTINQTGTAYLMLGQGANYPATVLVGTGGVYNTGTGLTTINTNGVLNISGGMFNANGGLAGSGLITLTDPSGGTALTINDSTATDVDIYSGTITGTGSIVITGGATQILSGTLSCGNVSVNSGTLNLSLSGTSNAINHLDLEGGLTQISSGTLAINGVGTSEGIRLDNNAVLNISNGAIVNAKNPTNSYDVILTGSTLNLTGAGTQLNAMTSQVQIGYFSPANLNVSGGASVTCQTFFDVADGTAGSNGSTATITSSSTVTANTVLLGNVIGATGKISVSGAGSTLTASSQINLGGLSSVAGTGLLTITNAGVVKSPIAYFYSASSAINISGGSLNTGSLSSFNTGYGMITLTDPIGGTALTINDVNAADINTYSGTISGAGSLLKSGASTQVLAGITKFGGLNVSGGILQVTGTTNTLAITSLTIGIAGKLDLTKDSADISTNSLASITALAKTGFANGTWNGAGGIVSNTASADTNHLTALGVIQNNQSGGVFFYAAHPFEGIVPGPGDILVKYTYYGDTNFDGKVDGSDYSRIDNAYILDKANPTNATGWFNGDFNYDGVVNGSDYTLIDNAFNRQGAQLTAETASATAQIAVSAVPEPGSILVALLGTASLLGRRKSAK